MTVKKYYIDLLVTELKKKGLKVDIDNTSSWDNTLYPKKNIYKRKGKRWLKRDGKGRFSNR